MTEPRRDDRDDILPLSLDDRSLDDRPGPVDLSALSPEARLATALVMQAQALDGMRRNQADLVQRLSDGGDAAGPVRDALHRFHERIDEVRSSQRATAGELRRIRRRARLQLGALAVVIAAFIAGASWWIVERLPAPRDDAPILAAIDAGAARADEAVSRVAAASEARLGGQVAAALGGLQERLDDGEARLRQDLAAVTARRDELAEELARARRAEEEARRASAESVAEIDALKGERARLLGENTRLRNQILDQERARSELQQRIDELAAQMQAMVTAPARVEVSTGGPATGLAERANAALAASGARTARLVEAGSAADGELRAVLFVRLAADGTPIDTLAADRAALRIDPSGLSLVATRGTADRETVLRLDLPDPDLAALAAAGLAVPAQAGRLGAVRAALEALISARGYRLEQLAGVEGAALHGLVLVGEGRRIAASAGRVIADGPALLLEDGSLTTERDTRPFFHGTYRLSLPGADFAAWASTLAQAGVAAGPDGRTAGAP